MNMKSVSLLVLRFTTGIYIAFWGINKIINTAGAMRHSETYYGSLTANDTVLLAIGVLQIIVGIAVIIGLMRKFSYLALVGLYFFGLAGIIQYILDPFGLYLVDQARLTWFPSATLLAAAWVSFLFRDEDTLTLDAKLGK